MSEKTWKGSGRVQNGEQFIRAGSVATKGVDLKKGDIVNYITVKGTGAKYKRAVQVDTPDIEPDYSMYANGLLSVVNQIIPNEPWVKNFHRKRKR